MKRFTQLGFIYHGKRKFKQPLNSVMTQKNVFDSEDVLGKAVLGKMILDKK